MQSGTAAGRARASQQQSLLKAMGTSGGQIPIKRADCHVIKTNDVSLTACNRLLGSGGLEMDREGDPGSFAWLAVNVAVSPNRRKPPMHIIQSIAG